MNPQVLHPHSKKETKILKLLKHYFSNSEHWWKLDPSSAEMTPRLALLPAWQIRIPERGIALIHGLNGQLIPM